MAEASIPVDLFNPGQVFACFGFLEAAIELLGDAEAIFDWREPQARFRIRAPGDESPIAHVLGFIDAAEARAHAPLGSPSIDEWKGAWGPTPETRPPSEGYPFRDPKMPAMLVCCLTDDAARSLSITHWGDSTARDKAKFWAGAGGKPGTAFIREALAAVRGRAAAAAADPFALSAPRSSLRFDVRADYAPIDAGFSLNHHDKRFVAQSYPLVDILAALGLTNARPAALTKLAYTYAVVGRDNHATRLWLSPPLLRASLGGPKMPFPMRRFRMCLTNPGKDDRLVATVTEES